MLIEFATGDDAEEILALQKLAYLSEAILYDDFTIDPITQKLEEIQLDIKKLVYLKTEIHGKIIGSVRGYLQDMTCFVGRLIVHPDYQNQGIGTKLMQAIEEHFLEARRFELFTGDKSKRTITLYKNLGYCIFKNEQLTDRVRLVYLNKLIAD